MLINSITNINVALEWFDFAKYPPALDNLIKSLAVVFVEMNKCTNIWVVYISLYFVSEYIIPNFIDLCV